MTSEETTLICDFMDWDIDERGIISAFGDRYTPDELEAHMTYSWNFIIPMCRKLMFRRNKLDVS